MTGFGDTTAARASARTSSSLHGFADDEHWVELARKYKVRLPLRATPLSTGKMSSWLRKLGLSNKQYLEWTGGQNRAQFIEANPTWTLRAFVGLCLEYVDENATSLWPGRLKSA